MREECVCGPIVLTASPPACEPNVPPLAFGGLTTCSHMHQNGTGTLITARGDHLSEITSFKLLLMRVNRPNATCNQT
jgi:hypothetical protein